METFWTLTVILLALSSGTEGDSGQCLVWSACSASCGEGVKTLTITQKCNEKPCKPSCGAGLDIVIILDKSKSVEIEPLKVVLKFIKSLIEAFNPAPSGDHFGLITFHKDARTVFKFSDSKYHNKAELLKKIDEEPIALDYFTHTDLALEKARDEFFTAAGGDRPDKPNLLIVLTDGEPWYSLSTPSEADFKKFADAISQDFAQKNVYRVAIGFGPKAKEPKFARILQYIAGAGNPVFQITDVNTLKNMVKAIKASACSE